MLKFVTQFLATFVAVLVGISEVQGHGMLLDPPSRSSRWRYDSQAPANYDDNALYCGGFGTQWSKNGGKCGFCGDSYSDPTPRANELGGKYGQGVITRNYANTHTAYLGIRITANHLGFFYFNLCNLDEFGEESDECFNKYPLQLVDGSFKQYIGSATGWVNSTVVLPNGLSCNHCVLKWSYQAGNNWGYCDDGRGALGCGPQENFKGCADVSINASGREAPLADELPEVDELPEEVADKVPDNAPELPEEPIEVEPIEEAVGEPLEEQAI